MYSYSDSLQPTKNVNSEYHKFYYTYITFNLEAEAREKNFHSSLSTFSMFINLMNG